MSGAGIAETARGWLGTPYVHQASRRGAGCDCLGLVRGIWRELEGAEPAALPPYTMDWSEPQGEERLLEAARTHLSPKLLQDAALGDVLLFRMRAGSVAKHLGIQSWLGSGHEGGGVPPRFIHAYAGRGVVECALSTPWQRRIVARFAFPQEGL